MTTSKFLSPFFITAVLILLAGGMIWLEVFVFQDYPIFTSEEDIDASIDTNFGVFAPYL